MEDWGKFLSIAEEGCDVKKLINKVLVKKGLLQNWPLVKIPHFWPILMKLGENNHFMRQSFSPSFMRIGQRLWIFY